MKDRYPARLLVSSFLSISFLAACGSNSDSTTGPTGPTTLQITDVTVGTGATAVAGDDVTVQYIGSFLDGTVFDSSYSRGSAFSFVLGANQVIRGFDQAVTGMKIGGRRVAVVPSNLAYGAQGSGSIPPNTPIQFQIDLIGIAGK